MSLAEPFLAHAGPLRDRLGAVPDLEARLAALLQAGRAAWPRVGISGEAFMRHLAERAPDQGEPVAALEAYHAADLYLACGCAAGDPEALRAFETALLAPVGELLQRRGASAATTDEIKQALRARLLVREGETPPRIASYAGQGPLAAWLRMAATRTAVNLRLEQREQAPFDEDSPLFIESPSPDPEMAYLKTRYRAELESAFRSTLAALATRERTLLRLHFLDGMTAEALGTMYQVSARTVYRWISDARDGILRETRRLLAEKLQIAPANLETLLGLVQSQIDVSIWKVLRDGR